jgi:hypothetical protein
VKRQPTLFQTPDVYVIDTSAWSNIEFRPDSDDIWHLIKDLTEQGRIVACASVIDELREGDVYKAHIKPLERALKAGDRNDVEYLQLVGKITYEHPGMSRAAGWKTRADPYIVALAELENYVVVCDETTEHRPNRKIPGVCASRGIRCMTLNEFATVLKKEG